jgi:hypothetical protein
MTAPQPPETESFIQWGIKERDAAALALRKVHLTYHSAGAILLLLLALGVGDAWKWHIAEAARLEAQASVEKTKATNEHALGEKWKARAVALTDSVRVDTVRRQEIVYRTKTLTVQVPVRDSDGVTYSVPMDVVAKLDFDSLGAACERVQHDCVSALAAKDSVIAHDSTQAAALAALNANTAKQLAMQKHSTLWAKLLWGVGGIVIGRVLR